MTNEMQELIDQLGIDKTAELMAEYVNQKIPSEDIAMQFILEELEAASQGNDLSQIFARNSGFTEEDYKGAMKNSFEEVDGPNGPQQEISNLCMMLFPNQMLMAELRIRVIDNIMKHWELGKYSSIDYSEELVDVVEKNENHQWGIFANIMNDLGEYSKNYGEHDAQFNILRFMAYAYARRTAAAGLFLQGYWNQEHYTHVSDFFKTAQRTTGQSVEFQEDAAKQANKFLQSYDKRLSKGCISTITAAVELNQVKSFYDTTKRFTDEQIIEMFGKKNESIIICDKYGNEYKEIVSPYTGRIWLDRNLGAKRVPVSYDDEEGFGDYFQWGRNSDGHEKIDSETTKYLSKTSRPNHNSFIMPTDYPFDWKIDDEANLWNSSDALNSPCPKGYRLPTIKELIEEVVWLEEQNNIYGAYDNFLKLPAAGCRNNLDGKLYFENERIFLWTSDIIEVAAVFLSFDEDGIQKNGGYKAAGASVRCIKD